jgi:hypothetical protein
MVEKSRDVNACNRKYQSQFWGLTIRVSQLWTELDPTKVSQEDSAYIYQVRKGGALN